MSPWELPGITLLLHELQRTWVAWAGSLHALLVTVHPSCAKHHPAVLCQLLMPVTPLQSHQHLSLRDSQRCDVSHSSPSKLEQNQ